jgi:hypothetical protein
VARCQGCQRLLCLSCAIPFRGRVLCAADAARELGAPEPLPQPVARSARRPLVTVGLLLLALVATFPPWHRSGVLTSVLSAWRPTDPWAMVSCLALGVGTLLAVGTAIRGRRPAWLGPASAGAALAGGAAAIVALLRAPDYFSPTPAPFAVVALTLGVAAIGFFRTT